ncbi:HAD hydrolase-like protein [Desulfovibrio sulfodismutans]|uniref:phosphoglycolate phosphatase n=1 Tax=Desulfolutivibrio sulfodismutans TaxID=63561 RepID=A0A7K3NLI9_9BACT|nr:HAD hydrolase-like protein [Desulfolutivibrio sulfodismutans]QLA12496.1 HAD hydrolase-like protein [Desulfolutivibrio sulfodismutans DSM 3696]
MDDCVPQRQRKINAVVFDFDGTLAHLVIDFEAMKRRVADIAAKWLPMRPEPDGLPALEWIDALRREVETVSPGDGSAFFLAAHADVQALEVEAAAQGGLFPFTRDMLAQLSRRGVGTAIITRNCAAAVAMVFPDAADYCRAVLAREAVPRVKPDPGHLLAALDILRVPPGEALMVGDHPLDVETGRLAGTRTAGVASGRVSREELGRAGADHTADDARELMETLFGEGT